MREIGSGGYSRVFEAREFEFDRLVAIKVLNEPLRDSTTAAAFERECRSMGRLLHHPNIVTVIKSAFTAEDQPCIVMELFHQGSYFGLLRNSGPVSEGEVLRVGVKVAGALATAHAAGVLHGDVKPHNIFRSVFSEPALGDFGISTFVGRREGRLARGFSVHYAAPELIDGAPGHEADQYSLAATLYTLGLGRRPFEAPDSTTGSTNEEVLLRVLKEPVPRLPGRYSPVLAETLWRAMAKDPDYRFESLTEFAEALNAAETDLGLQPTVMPFESDATPVVPSVGPQAPGAPSPGPKQAAATAPPAQMKPPEDEGPVDVVEPGPADDEVESPAGNDGDSEVADEPEPPEPGVAVGRAVLPDGRVELLDVDVIVGRNPLRSLLEEHQRAVTLGEGDRAVSRRHIELRVTDSQVTAVCLGQHAVVVTADGAVRGLSVDESHILASGDTVEFGTSAWLRYETGSGEERNSDEFAGTDEGANSEADGGVPAGPEGEDRGGAAGGSVSDYYDSRVPESVAEIRDSTTRDLDLAALNDADSPLSESAEADESAELADAADSAGPQSEWSILFSDGSVEPLDTELIIGRSPMREPLGPHQRGVVQGADDLTVSRRHLELRVREDGLQATNLGRFTAITTAAGEQRELVGGELVRLQPGDELHFGTESWLRCMAKGSESSEKPAD